MCPRTRKGEGAQSREKARLEAKLRPREDTEPEKDPGEVTGERAVGEKVGKELSE